MFKIKNMYVGRGSTKQGRGLKLKQENRRAGRYRIDLGFCFHQHN